VLLAAVTFREVQVIRGGGDSFFSYVRIGGMLFVCVIGALVWLIETTKPGDPADPESSSDSAATTQEPRARSNAQ
jgi:hypothetical protein